MSMSRLMYLCSAAALSVSLSTAASATTVTVTTGPQPLVLPAGTITFDGTNTANTPGFTFTGASGTANNNVYAQYAAPAGDTTFYAYVDPNGLIVDTLSAPASSLSFYWGSVDSYNTIAINTTGGTFLFGQGGAALPSGIVMDGNNSYYVTFTAAAGAINSVNFSSSNAAFEFDNVSSVAAASAVPEPSSLVLLGTGLAGLSSVIRRRLVRKS